MKLHLFQYECKSCKNIFKSPELVGDPYGEFLLKNKNGQLVYLNAMDNKIFQEVSSMLKLNKNTKDMQDTKRAKILHYIFGVACDVAPDGYAFGIMQMPTCSYCGQISIGHWGPTNPPEYIEQNVPHSSHKKWNSLSNEEKKLLIDDAVKDYLSGN